jgi:amidase
MVGQDPNDLITERAGKLAGVDYKQYLKPDRIKGKRIGLVTNGKYNPRREDLIILRHAADLFKRAGAEVVEIKFRGSGVDYTGILLYGIHHDVNDYLRATGANAQASSMADIVAYNKEDMENRAPYGQNYLEESLDGKMTADEYRLQAKANREKAASAIHAALAKNHIDYLMSYSSWLAGSYAVAGFPAITMPGMYRGNGEPVGVTLVGDDLQDWELISAACAWEQVAKPLHVEPSLNG